MTYIHTGLPILTKTAQRSLSMATSKIKAALAENGKTYDIRDLNDVMAQWLESSIELLCEEACEMCITGDRTYSSFNRQAFENLLKPIQYSEAWETEGAIAQMFQDQMTLSLERAA